MLDVNAAQGTPTFGLGLGPSATARHTPPLNATLDSLISGCIRDGNGDPATAALLMQERVRGNKAALAELVQPYLADACLKAVNRRLGAAIVAPEDPPPNVDTSARLHAMAEVLLDFRLPSGKLLRDGFAQDIRDAASWYLRRAATLGQKGRWLSAIAVKVPRGSTAGDVLSETDLSRLLQEARG